MANDGGLRPLFHQRLKVGFHWQSIETGGTGLGIPDSNCCASGIEFWVEFKQTHGWNVTLRPEQVGWLIRRSLAGGRTFVAVRRQSDAGPRKGDAVDELWLYNGRWARELLQHGLKWEGPRLGRYGGGPSEWPWQTVGSLLTARAPGTLEGSGLGLTSGIPDLAAEDI